MAKNKLTDLNDHLYAAIEGIEALEDADGKITDNEAMLAQVEKAKAISDIAKVIIDNSKLQFDVYKYRDSYNIKDADMPTNLLCGGKNVS